MDPSVGVVIPAHNAQNYIEECLLSVINQTYTNWRMFIVDDHSQDQTPAILKSIQKEYPTKIELVCRSCNLGEGYTRQEATDLALKSGCHLIATLDADDLWKPEKLRLQVDIMSQNQDAALCYGLTDYINWKGEPHPNPWWEKLTDCIKGVPQGEVWKHIICFGKIGTMDTIIIRREAAEQCRCNPSLRYFADLDYLAQIATLKYPNNFVGTNDVVASYRFHGRQSPLTANLDEFLDICSQTMVQITKKIFARLELQERPVNRSLRRFMWRVLLFRIMLKYVLNKRLQGIPGLALKLAFPLKYLEGDINVAKKDQDWEDFFGVWETIH